MMKIINLLIKKKSIKIHTNINDVEDSQVEEHKCGDMIHKCKYCSAVFFADEEISGWSKKSKKSRFSLCCNHGKINVPVPEIPKEIIDLFTSTDKKVYGLEKI